MSFWKDIRHFKPAEFDSPDAPGSGLKRMDEAFIRRIDELRHRLGEPVIITSGYRTPAYNMKVSSTGADGPHTTGKAADILCHGTKAFEVLRLAMGLGFTGIGLKQSGPHSSRFIHIDMIESNIRPWVWTY